MGEVENIKDEFDRLGANDKRWVWVCAAVAVAGVLFAFFVGNAIGDVVGFALAVGAGWLLRSQWQMVSGRRSPRTRRTASSAKPRSHTRAARRTTKATTKR
jgi:hypothetical protein